jgi:uncharacterized low-complexity protein
MPAHTENTMSSQKKPVAIAIGAALVGGLTLAGSAFAMQPLASGYMVASASVAEGACGAVKKAGEGSCGGDKAKAEGKCGEGKCGMDRMDADKDSRISQAEFAAAHDNDASMFGAHDTNKDGFISADEMKAHMEGKCGEGKCGADKATAKPAEKKAGMEGKCGEGKCGSN